MQENQRTEPYARCRRPTRVIGFKMRSPVSICSISEAPRNEDIVVGGMTIAVEKKTSKFRLLKSFMKVFGVASLLLASSPAFPMYYGIWEQLAHENTALAKRMLLCEENTCLDDITYKQLVAAYTFYKEGNEKQMISCFKALDEFLADFFIRRTINLPEEFQVDPEW